MRKCSLVLFLSLATASIGWAQSEAEPNIVTRCFTIPISAQEVAATEPGNLRSLRVEEGDTVNKDQVVAEIDKDQAEMAEKVALHEYHAAKKQAENEISVAAAVKANEVAKLEFDSANAANRRTPNAYPDTEIRKLDLNYVRSGLQADMARFELVVAALQARAKYSQYEQAKLMVGRRELKTAHAGVVMQIFKREGDWVSPGDRVMRLVRLDTLRVTGRVSAVAKPGVTAYHWRDMVGRPVEVTVELPGGKEVKVPSKIAFAAQEVEQDGTYRIWADIENQMEGNTWLMGPGLQASMNLQP